MNETAFRWDWVPLIVLAVTVFWLLYLFMLWWMKRPSQVDTFQELLAEWAAVTFPEETLDGVLNHLHKEVEEFRANPEDVGELADVFMLTCQAATKAGFPMSLVLAAAVEKHSVNLNRKWGPVNDRGFQEHDRKLN